MQCDFCKFLRASIFSLSLLLLADGAFAAVTFFGSVNPDPPGDGNVEATLSIGLEGDDDADLRGYVLIDGGSQIEYDGLTVGDTEGYRGELVIAGSLVPGGQSQLTLEEGGSNNVPTVQVGHEGVGQLSITGGGALVLANSSADLSIGVETSGIGTMTVAGAFSLAVIPNELRVGDDGIGRLEILDGGMVYASDPTNTVLVGATSAASGSVLVDGAGAIWKLDDNLTIGSVGVGTVTVSNQGLVDADRSGAITLVGNRGRLELDGGTFAGTQINVDGYLGGGGLVRGNVSNFLDALIDVPAGALLQFTDSVTNQGSVRIRGGEATFTSAFNNLATGGQPAPGRIALEDGRVRFAQPLANNGVLAATGGVNHVHGAITNGTTGAIVVASDTVATFYDTVDIAAGSLDLLAGANALFLAILTFESGGLATLQIGDTGPAQIYVSGAATLAGDLEITLAGGFEPTAGASFPLLLADSGLTGTFDFESLPPLSTGLEWDLDYTANQVVLNVLSGFSADLDIDGDVDGADFLAIQRTDPALIPAWESQYGSGLAGAASTPTAVNTAVPEPSAFLLLFGAVASGGLGMGARLNRNPLGDPRRN